MTGPPRHALHGPFEGYLDKPAVLEVIHAGECDCACCKYRGDCPPLPKIKINGAEHGGWMWIRQETPKQLRSGRRRSVMQAPVWIFESVRWA